MCGRYAASRDPEALVEEFEIDRVDPGPRLPASFNVAPTDQVYGVLSRTDHDSGAVRRRLHVLRWGLVPSWAKDRNGASRLINARMETVADKPAFRRAFAKRRCLLPADGYYEWYKSATGAKQPFFITSRDGSPLAMAGIYEIWRDASRPDEDPEAFLWTASVLTTRAEDEVGMIHDRMPLVVPRERFAEWLDPRHEDADVLRALLLPAAPGMLAAYPVSTEVNSVRNNGPHLIVPLAPDDEARSEEGKAAGLATSRVSGETATARASATGRATGMAPARSGRGTPTGRGANATGLGPTHGQPALNQEG